MDDILKIALVGDNLLSKIDIVNEIKNKYTNQFIMVLDTNNMPSDTVYEEYWLNFDAVFYLGHDNNDNKKLLNWLGHNHFRFFDDSKDNDIIISNIDKEMNILINDIELERKLLIEMPNLEHLKVKYPVYKTHIEQTYLNCPKGTHRLRKRSSNNVNSYFETIKIRLTNSKCVESENVIDEKMYNLLMKEKDETKRTIVKDRYFILFEGNRFELDVYDFWDDRATVELEIPNENYIFNLPPEIKLIKDVSEDYMYKNKYLAGLSYEDCKTTVL